MRPRGLVESLPPRRGQQNHTLPRLWAEPRGSHFSLFPCLFPCSYWAEHPGSSTSRGLAAEPRAARVLMSQPGPALASSSTYPPDRSPSPPPAAQASLLAPPLGRARPLRRSPRLWDPASSGARPAPGLGLHPSALAPPSLGPSPPVLAPPLDWVHPLQRSPRPLGPPPRSSPRPWSGPAPFGARPSFHGPAPSTVRKTHGGRSLAAASVSPSDCVFHG